MKITGKITGSDGDVLPGAAVFISDKDGKAIQPAVGTTAGADGIYSLEVPEMAFVTATFVGTKRVTARPTPITNFHLVDDNTLPEVVVTAPKTPKTPVKKPVTKPIEQKPNYLPYIAGGIGFLLALLLLKKFVFKK